MLYRHALKPILFKFDPEDVHDAFTAAGEFMGGHAIASSLAGAVYGYRGPDISKTVDGLTYRTPFLLSAGFDYNARLSRILPHIGLGGEEIGSVTARPCGGNDRPRLARLPRSKSIIVNKGLRNDGVDAIIERMKRTPREQGFVRGVSIAKTNDAGCSDVAGGIADYAYSFRRLVEEDAGDFYTINISCPNSFGGEAFTTPELLERLLSALRDIPCSKPVYAKMPINLAWDRFDALLAVIAKMGVNGVVIGNLNKDYGALDVRSEAPAEYAGGLSGKPCERLSSELIRKTRKAYGRRFTIFGAGGVMSPGSAKEKFDAGADLVQLISGLIFEGPGLVKKMCDAVARSGARA